MHGWVYVVSNDFIDGYVKVGKTRRTPVERIEEFEKSSAAPGQYAVEYAVEVSDCGRLESGAQFELGELATEYNKDIHKEWFSVSPKVAAETIEATMKRLTGFYRIRTLGQALRSSDSEPFEYICFKCRTRFTETDVQIIFRKPDLRKAAFNNDMCKSCQEDIE